MLPNETVYNILKYTDGKTAIKFLLSGDYNIIDWYPWINKENAVIAHEVIDLYKYLGEYGIQYKNNYYVLFSIKVNHLSSNVKLSDSLLNIMHPFVNWKDACKINKLTEETINKFFDVIDPNYIINNYENLSESLKSKLLEHPNYSPLKNIVHINSGRTRFALMDPHFRL